MKYGFTVPGRGPLATPDMLLIIAKHGEELGFDSIQTGDHILVPKNIDSTYPYTDTGEFPGLSSGSSLEQLTLLTQYMIILKKKDLGIFLWFLLLQDIEVFLQEELIVHLNLL